MANILVVIDSLELGDKIKDTLIQDGHRVFVMPNARQARLAIKFTQARATRMRPNVILVDNQLPDTVGTDFCRYLRTQAAETPLVLMIEVNAVYHELDALMANGTINACLYKPFKIASLILLINSLLEAKKI